MEEPVTFGKEKPLYGATVAEAGQVKPPCRYIFMAPTDNALHERIQLQMMSKITECVYEGLLQTFSCNSVDIRLLLNISNWSWKNGPQALPPPLYLSADLSHPDSCKRLCFPPPPSLRNPLANTNAVVIPGPEVRRATAAAGAQHDVPRVQLRRRDTVVAANLRQKSPACAGANLLQRAGMLLGCVSNGALVVVAALVVVRGVVVAGRVVGELARVAVLPQVVMLPRVVVPPIVVGLGLVMLAGTSPPPQYPKPAWLQLGGSSVACFLIV